MSDGVSAKDFDSLVQTTPQSNLRKFLGFVTQELGKTLRSNTDYWKQRVCRSVWVKVHGKVPEDDEGFG